MKNESHSSTSRIAGFIFTLTFLLFYSLAGRAQVSSLPNGFPSNDAGDGEFLVTSQGISSLGAPPASGAVFNVHVRIPITETQLQIELFDPDLYAKDDATAYWDFPPLGSFVTEYEEYVRFELYPDVNIVGNINPAQLIASLLLDPNVIDSDNKWVDFFQGTPYPIDQLDPLFSAACETGPGAQFCYFHLVGRWVETDLPHAPKLNATSASGNVINSFLVSSNGLPFLAAGSSVGIMGLTENNPAYPVPPPIPPATGYDGTVSLRALVTESNQCAIDIYDGDFDRAGTVDTAGYPDESDDPNTPNDAVATGFFPFVLSSATVEEGIRPGNPADNGVPNGIGSSSIGTPISYAVNPEPPTVPYGVNCCVNDNPSGDREWELYRIASTAPGCPNVTDPNYDPDGAGPAPVAAPDEVVDTIGQGFHSITMNGMDRHNLNFLNVSADVFAGEAFDFGDAPESYQTTIGANGPQHDADARLVLGVEVDIEFDGIASVNADSDDNALLDDEDGVAGFASINTDMVGELYNVDVAVRNELEVPANLLGWTDFNGNGTFEAIGESASAPVNPGDTTVMLSFIVPADVSDGDTYARFRITTDPAISTTTPGGEAFDGEVEDYRLTIDPGTPGGSEGCTPGYWKQKHHYDSWVTYFPNDSYEDIFGVVGYNKTLKQALSMGGGGKRALGRHSVAALLNAANDEVDYLYTEQQVIDIVQQAFAENTRSAHEQAKDLFEEQNELGCPLN